MLAIYMRYLPKKCGLQSIEFAWFDVHVRQKQLWGFIDPNINKKVR